MTATPIDLAITLTLLFVLFASCAAGVLALPWSERELEASTRAARTLRSLPALALNTLATPLQRSIRAIAPWLLHPTPPGSPIAPEAV